jgi:hypothetical protein
VSYFGVLWCFFYRHTPAQDQRQGLAFRGHRQIYALNWNPPRKPETLHGITSLTARQANPADLLAAATDRVMIGVADEIHAHRLREDTGDVAVRPPV